jgi:predicted flap endonuclease-1-like 5' DNA nuclease
MSYLVTQMLLYLLGALLLGLLLGWFIWGQRSSQSAGIQADVDRLRNENYGLRRDLAECNQARTALESQRAEARAAKANAAPEPGPAASPAAAKAAVAPAKSQPPATLMSKPAKTPPKKGTAKAPAAPGRTSAGAKAAAPVPAAAKATAEPTKTKPAATSISKSAKAPPKKPTPKGMPVPAAADPALAKAAAEATKSQPPATLMSKPAKAPKKPTAKAPAAEKPATAKTAEASSPKIPKPIVRPDDLRRIVGIGPVNERLLHLEGVRTFAQIAQWTAADVMHIEEVLQFDGRVERESWIEQAKLLAAGDEKEFARRFPTASSDKNT